MTSIPGTAHFVKGCKNRDSITRKRKRNTLTSHQRNNKTTNDSFTKNHHYQQTDGFALCITEKQIFSNLENVSMPEFTNTARVIEINWVKRGCICTVH